MSHRIHTCNCRLRKRAPKTKLSSYALKRWYIIIDGKPKVFGGRLTPHSIEWSEPGRPDDFGVSLTSMSHPTRNEASR